MNNLEHRYILRGFVYLVRVSFCIKAIAQRHFITNILIQTMVSKLTIFAREIGLFLTLEYFASLSFNTRASKNI